MIYKQLNQNERIRFYLEDHSGFGITQRRAAGGWVDMPDGPHFARQFEPEGFHNRHFENWATKLTKDKEYRQQWAVKNEFDQIFPPKGDPISAQALPAQPESRIEDYLGYTEPAAPEPPPVPVVGLIPTKQPNNQLTQGCPDSFAIKAIAPNGFEICLTLTGSSKELFGRAAVAIDWLSKNDYRPTCDNDRPESAPASQPAAAALALPAAAPQPTAGPAPLPVVGQTAPTLPNNQPTPPPLAPPQPLTFEAEVLTVTMDETGLKTKVKGAGGFGRYGLRIWPEVLEAAGISPAALQPGQTYNLAGWVAEYVNGDNGRPLKVTALSRGA